MRYFLLILASLIITGCGVDTSSSTNDSSLSDSQNGTSDSTGTDSDGESVDSDGGTTILVDDASSSGFDKTDAVEDSSACLANSTFDAFSDSSFDPLAAADAINGLELASQYDYSVDLEATTVALFYPSLVNTLEGTMVNIYEESYRLSFDKAWVSSSAASVYVRTPKNIYGAYSCYRYDLNTLSNDSLTKTKVYR